MDLERRCTWVARSLLLGALVLGVLTLRDYGLTFDEPMRASAGEEWWRFIATWDPRYLPSGFMVHYGALFDMLGAALWHVHRRFFGGQDEYLARHALILLTGWLGWLGTYKLAQRVAPQPVPVLALAMLVLTPRYYGACFNNPKDVPFAATAVWGLYGLVRWLQEPRLGTAVWSGLLTALCISVRPFGVLLVPLGVIAWLACRPAGAAFAKHVGGYLLSALVFGVALWPMLWVRPPWHVFRSVKAFGAPLSGSSHLYFGELASSSPSPRGYVAVWSAITLPLATLLLAAVGAVALWITGRRQVSSFRDLGARRAFCLPALLSLWVGVPVVLPILRPMSLYSGVRHFLFLMPVVAVFAAIGLVRVFSVRPAWLRAALVSLAALSYADVVREEVRLHPYQSLYFSRLTGGIRGAERAFDVAHFGESHAEAFEWLSEHHARSGKRAPARVNTVGGRYTFDVPAYYAGKYGMPFNTPLFEYTVAEVRLDRQNHFHGQVLHTVSREGVPLALVMEVDPMQSPEIVWVGSARAQERGDAASAPWRSVPGQDGFFDTVRPSRPVDEPEQDGLAMAVTLHSPQDQVVSLYWGYLGQGTVRVRAEGERGDPRPTGSAGRPVEAFASLRPLVGVFHPALVRTDVGFRRGDNRLRVDLSGMDRTRGLYLHYPRSHGLTASSLPPE